MAKRGLKDLARKFNPLAKKDQGYSDLEEGRRSRPRSFYDQLFRQQQEEQEQERATINWQPPSDRHMPQNNEQGQRSADQTTQDVVINIEEQAQEQFQQHQNYQRIQDDHTTYPGRREGYTTDCLEAVYNAPDEEQGDRTPLRPRPSQQNRTQVRVQDRSGNWRQPPADRAVYVTTYDGEALWAINVRMWRRQMDEKTARLELFPDGSAWRVKGLEEGETLKSCVDIYHPPGQNKLSRVGAVLTMLLLLPLISIKDVKSKHV